MSLFLTIVNYTASFGWRKQLNYVKNICKLYIHIQGDHDQGIYLPRS